MDIIQLEELSIEKIYFILFNRVFFGYLREREKNIENLKDFLEEKEYYKFGEIVVQWFNYEKGRCKIYVLRLDSRV